MISLLIVDDSALVRDGLSSLLRLQPDFHILDTAEDGLEAVEKVSTLNPDVVIMDAQMPNVDGMKATEKIKSSSPCVGVVILSAFADYREESICAGCDGCLLKDCDPTELFQIVRDVASRMKDCKESAAPAGAFAQNSQT